MHTRSFFAGIGCGLALAVGLGAYAAGSFKVVGGVVGLKPGGSVVVVCVDESGTHMIEGSTPQAPYKVPMRHNNMTAVSYATRCP